MHHTGYWGLSYTTTKYHNAAESEEQSITLVTLVPSLIQSVLAFTTSSSLILPGTLDSFLTQKCPRRSTSAKLLILSLNVLVQSAGFSLKMQPRLWLLPISSHGLTTATVSSWVHLILSSNLSRKFKSLLQDTFSWYAAITTQHPS